jgi:PAS domain S-box-containing protein
VSEVRDYAILTLDTEGRVTTWNEGAERIKGYCAEEIIGQPLQSDLPEIPHRCAVCRRELRPGAV